MGLDAGEQGAAERWVAKIAHRNVDGRGTCLRSGRDDAAVIVALNLADEAVTLTCADATEVVAGAGQIDPAAQQVRLEPRGWAALRR